MEVFHNMGWMFPTTGWCKCSCKVPKWNYMWLAMIQESDCLTDGKSSVGVVIAIFVCKSFLNTST